MKKRIVLTIFLIIVSSIIFAIGINSVDAANTNETNNIVYENYTQTVDNVNEIDLSVEGTVKETSKCTYSSRKVKLNEDLTASDYNQTTHAVEAYVRTSKTEREDILGKTEEITTIRTYNVIFRDTIAPGCEEPIIQNIYSSGYTRVDAQKVTIKCNEKIQVPDGWTMSTEQRYESGQMKTYYNISKTYYTSVGNTSVSIKDLAGNVTTKSFSITKIPPKITNITQDAGLVTITLNQAVDKQIYLTNEDGEQYLDAINSGFTAWTKGTSSTASLAEDWEKVSDTVYKKQFKTAAVETIRLRKTYGSTTNVSNTDVICSSIVDKEGPIINVTQSAPKTDGSVTVTLTANEKIRGIDGWVQTDDLLTLTKDYYENKVDKVTVYDLAGNPTEVTITIKDVIDYSRSTTQFAIKSVVYTANSDGTKTVTITVNKPAKELSGWTLSSDKLTLTKSYNETTVEKITIAGAEGGTADRTISVYVYAGSNGSGNSGSNSNGNGSGSTNNQTGAEVTDVKKTTNSDGSITVTITFDKEITEVPEGWTISADKKSISKTYSKNAASDELITVKDANGNTTSVSVSPTNGTAKVLGDNTTANKAIPQTGQSFIITFCILASIFGIIVFGIEYKKLKDMR